LSAAAIPFQMLCKEYGSGSGVRIPKHKSGQTPWRAIFWEDLMQLTRRAALAGAAAATAFSSVSALSIYPSFAQGASNAMSGVVRNTLGDVEVIQLLEGIRNIQMPDKFITNLSKDQTVDAFTAAHMPNGVFRNPYCPSVVKAGGKTIVIDTGNGIAALAATKGELGHHRSNLQAAGIDVKAVDIVLISHFHGDHINGLRNPDGTLAYPNAEIRVPATEWAYWTDEGNLAKTPASNKGNFANVKKIFADLKPTHYEAGKEVAPGITAIATPGHTPGHMSFVVASGSKRVLIQGDVALAPEVFAKHPDYQVVFDVLGDVAVATRKKVYDMALAEKLPVIGYHFAFGTVNYVEKAGDGYRMVPSNGGLG
jgi:glyoxylase-like metal-dependent hydrolase (beta-lactamase superfamily II)